MYCKSAVISLVLGMASMTVYFLPMPLNLYQGSFLGSLLGILAIIISRKARREIEFQPTLKGLRFAFVARTLGVIGVAFGFMAVGVWVFSELMLR